MKVLIKILIKVLFLIVNVSYIFVIGENIYEIK